MDDTSPIPSTVSLSELKQQHGAIISEIIRSGYTYEQLAAILGIENGAALRRYLQRDTARPPRRDNVVLHKIHAALVRGSNNFLKLVPDALAANYQAAIEGQRRDSIVYGRCTDKGPISSENLRALSLIGHDVFRIDYNFSMNMLKRLCGSYYAYRASTKGDVIVKSQLDIMYQEDDVYVEFLHHHPDRFFGQRTDENVPRRTHGLGFYLGTNIFLIGNTEQGQAINIFALREPIRTNYYIITGYNLTSNLDRVLISARTVLIKQEGSAESGLKGIGRIKVDEFRTEEHKFDLSLLNDAKEPYICENASLIRSNPRR